MQQQESRERPLGDTRVESNDSSYDFFDGPPLQEHPEDYYWWQRFAILERKKKLLYGASAASCLFLFIALLLMCATVGTSTEAQVQALGGGSLSMLFCSIAAIVVQLVFYQRHEIIVA